MSAAFVPGWMRRRELASMMVCSICCVSRLAGLPAIDGDLGPIWISAGGGGLGSRGLLGACDIVETVGACAASISAAIQAVAIHRSCGR